MRITAVTCVKNEGPFLLEWIAFNRVLGVTDFLFYSNDCTDATDKILDALQDRGIVTHLPNPAQGRNYQMEALKAAKKHDLVLASDWTWIADVDEFLNIHVGNGTIPELIEACGDPHAISITFQFFANCDIDDYVDKPVIEQFTRSHNPDIWCDQTAQEVKTLIRHDFPVKYYGAHRPFMKDKLSKDRRPKWTDGSGRDVPWKYRTAANKRRIRKFPAGGARNFATLNHYALRSLDSYLVKNDRGDVNRENRDFDDTYWRERNDDAWEDTSIKRYLPRLRAEMKALMADKEIADLHAEAVAAHKATLDRLLADEDYVTLRKQLKSVPKLSPAELALLELIA
ncbi:glycosyltransferase family 2 protein [Aliiroseovarius subalbicans]|uniref:glycosyltransferase family 2 protein n=1 Tax=Aliiroseovarius subalbicans TaxID=2925840 RepID=UPI001F58E54C|nr:glycosyltransferase family 2 protein [Aliiroseovarius subalbicans]MCI2398850.1 glycosyltransferase family 2 protein [Aliiroseovarius subalbicans]